VCALNIDTNPNPYMHISNSHNRVMYQILKFKICKLCNIEVHIGPGFRWVCISWQECQGHFAHVENSMGFEMNSFANCQFKSPIYFFCLLVCSLPAGLACGLRNRDPGAS
jgi:hypothetical protein